MPELPRYKLDSNQQIVIDDLVENEKHEDKQINSENTEIAEHKDVADVDNQGEVNEPHSKQEAPMPEREGKNNLEK